MIFENISLAIVWDKHIWAAIIALVFAVFIVISAIFAYHWKRYGHDLKKIKGVSFIYLLVSAGIMILILLTYNTL